MKGSPNMGFIGKFKGTAKKYNHAWVFLYVLIYLPWFHYLETRTNVTYYIIHSPLDDYIPFLEIFIVPYLLWFLYMAVAAFYFFFTNKRDFYRLASFLVAGMTAFLVICTVFPNGLNLRPTTFARDNIFTALVAKLYEADTSTNVLPSIHVYNSLGIAIAISHSEALKKHPHVCRGAYILTVLIIMSTMFLKQHSVTDVTAGFVMAMVVYPLVYVNERNKEPKLSSQWV